MLWFILAAIGAYIVADAFFDVSEKISRWVRGAWGKAREVVLGQRPPARRYVFQDFKDGKPLPVTEIGRETPKVTRSATAKIDFGRAAANVTGFVTGFIGWCMKHPMLAVSLVVLALWLVMGSPFGLGKSKGELRLEREIAEANTRVAQLEAHMGTLSRDLAVNTERDRTRVSTIVSQANEEIDNAVEAVDPDRLYDVYRDAYSSVWHDLAPRESNPPPGRSPAVREPSASPV